MEFCWRYFMKCTRQIGQFFGVIKEDDINTQWRNNFIKRAETGDIGLSLSNALSSSTNIQYQREKLIKQLEATVSQIITDDEDVSISNHILQKSSHFLSGYQNEELKQEIMDSQTCINTQAHNDDGDENSFPIDEFQELPVNPQNSPHDAISNYIPHEVQSCESSESFQSLKQNLAISKSVSDSDKFYDANENFNQSAVPSFTGCPTQVLLNNFVTGHQKKKRIKVFQNLSSNKTKSVDRPNPQCASKRNQVFPYWKDGSEADHIQVGENLNNSALETKDEDYKQLKKEIPMQNEADRSPRDSQNSPNKSIETRAQIPHDSTSECGRKPPKWFNDYNISKSEVNFRDGSQTMKSSAHQNIASSSHQFGSLSKLDLKSSILFKESEILEDEGIRLNGQEAFEHYLKFAALEKEMKLKEVNKTKDWVIGNYEWRINTVKLLSSIAKAYYTNPKGKERKMWKDLRREINQKSQHSLTDTRVQTSELRQFKPFFTYLVIAIHVMLFSILTSIGGLAPIGLQRSLVIQNNIKTFLGSETIHHWITPNIWIGLDRKSMIEMGGVYAPCIRDDISLQLEYIQAYGTVTKLGCCEVSVRNTAATTTQDECSNKTNGVGVWRSGTMCSERAPGQNSVHHSLKPCCLYSKSTCQLLSHSHCLFLGGTFHKDKDHCSQVNCLETLCGITDSTGKNKGLPVSPNQSWRILASLFYTHGVIHLLLLLCVEWFIMRPVEKGTGWFRLLLIFIISGSTSVMAASIISPYKPQVGSTGAVFGSLGVLIVELIQAWKFITKPKLQLLKLIIVVMFFLLSGMLPYVSNFAIMTGIGIGILSAMLFLPYITLSPYPQHGRVVLIIISFPLLFMMLFVIIFTYIKVQNPTGCPACQQFECVAFIDKMCDEP